MLSAPILPLLLQLAWPNVLVMLTQSSTGLIETYFVGKLGTDALTGMALVFPGVMLMQMISAGAMGGGISSAIARALGARRQDEADSLVLHAVFINGGLGLMFSVIMLLFGRPIYAALGGHGAALDAALVYSNVVFAGTISLWLMNAFASAIRGAGNMLVPALVNLVGALLLVPLSPALIFGIGPFPALGIAGGAYAFVAYNVAGALFLGWYTLSGRNVARLRPSKLRWPLFAGILRVGLVGAVGSVQTNLVIICATALVGTRFGENAIAGFGTGVRLEYLLVPLVFGFGAPIVAMVGTNIGAGQGPRALRIAQIGAAMSFLVCEIIGLAAALFPAPWLGLFSHNAEMLAAGSAYLRIVGPLYGFFGMGLALYFASQGAGRLLVPLLAGSARLLITLVIGWLALAMTGSLNMLFAVLALGLFAYGSIIAVVVGRGGWFRTARA
ncbi:MAG: MATE family efflux transporter [Hyphomicrobiales bacterium]|nr:MATE family efflux transporter [Hyphomicrobiales bacterium]